MVTRREWLGLTLGAGATLALNPRILRALQQQPMITRPIPSTGEQLPVVGLGSSATFGSTARGEESESLRAVLRALVEGGGKVFDTAPSYAGGDSEEVAGRLASELGIGDRIFWASKVNVARGGTADPAAARQQIDESFARMRRERVDLMQVHNLGDIPTQLAILKELKAAGRIRYIGTTTTSEGAYGELAAVMRNEPLDFIGVDYSVADRAAEETILPLAIERKIGVLVYVPFGRASLFRRVGDRPLPEWSQEFGAQTWAQFFLKFVAAHPAVTTVTPATSDAAHMADNLGGGRGALPDEATRRRMAEFIDALPQPAGRGRGRGGGGGR